jgi:hypothetical protein
MTARGGDFNPQLGDFIGRGIAALVAPFLLDRVDEDLDEQVEQGQTS